jgi:hypothetical protein
VAQSVITVLLVVLAVGLSLYVANVIVLAVVLAMLAVLLRYGYVMRKQMRTHAVLVYPVFGIVMLYSFLALTNALTFTAYSVAHNVNSKFSGRLGAPIYVYRMDIVARELGLYNKLPCIAVDDAAQLPRARRYFLLVSNEHLVQMGGQLGHVEPVAQGQWVVHKTGTFPRFLRLAKGEEPLEDIRLVQVGTP